MDCYNESIIVALEQQEFKHFRSQNPPAGFWGHYDKEGEDVEVNIGAS